MKIIRISLLCSLLVAACDKKPTTDAASKAGETVGEQLTEFTRSIGKGIDTKMMAKLTLDAAVTELGLSYTTAKALDMSAHKRGITVYFIASKDVDTTLRAVAVNGDDAEIGRSKAPVKLAKDEAAYITFEFPDEMDSMSVKEYRLGL